VCVCELSVLSVSVSVYGVCVLTLDRLRRYDDGPPFMVHPTLLGLTRDLNRIPYLIPRSAYPPCGTGS